MRFVVAAQREGSALKITLGAADFSDGGDCGHPDEGDGDGDSQCMFDDFFFLHCQAT